PAVRAGGLPVFKCGAAKQKAVSKDESGQAGCWSKNVTKPDTGGMCHVATGTPCMVTDDCPSGDTCDPGPILGACLTKVRGGLGLAFDKADVTPCPGDKTAVGAEVDNCVNALVNVVSSDGFGHIADPTLGKCAAGKLKAAGKAAAGKVGCRSK